MFHDYVHFLYIYQNFNVNSKYIYKLLVICIITNEYDFIWTSLKVIFSLL